MFFDSHTHNLLELQYNFNTINTWCMWDSVVDVIIFLNRPKASFHDICRCSKWLTISINISGQNYQHLTTSAYMSSYAYVLVKTSL